MRLHCAAFDVEGNIPAKYSGEGEDISPSLEWSGAPAETVTFALVCEDPDAPHRPGKDHPFVHWLIYNIPSSVSFLPEGIPAENCLERPFQARQGKNSFGKIGYGGPMPPVGHGMHNYVFTLYALGSELDLPPGVEKDQLLAAIRGHELNSAKLIGTYERRQKQDRAAG